MIQFYVNMIRNGRLQLEDVPDRWRGEVAAALSDDDDGGDN